MPVILFYANCAQHIKRLTCLKLKLIFYVIAMSNQELVDAGMKRMDETDQAIERSKQVSYKKKHVVFLTITLVTLLFLLFRL